MSGHKSSPLRDRLLSNSPDPIKSSILRESGLGWSSPSPAGQADAEDPTTTTSPLRISKHGSPLKPAPPSLARRSSSSYRHLRSNNLVSKSPFKSQIPITPRLTPTPSSPRKVSGEKRPRPQSMHEQAETENERPFALKRERRQSKTYQGLMEKEPVTKSPFRQGLPFNSLQTRAESNPPPAAPSRIPAPTAAASPARSSLVSRRLHGPRLSGNSRRDRRKTVTFDERCDVVEIDYEEEDGEGSCEESDVEMDVMNTEAEEDDDDSAFLSDSRGDDSYESIQLSDSAAHAMDIDPDTSITGIVDQMLASSSSTPPSHCIADESPTDVTTEGSSGFKLDPASPAHSSSPVVETEHDMTPQKHTNFEQETPPGDLSQQSFEKNSLDEDVDSPSILQGHRSPLHPRLMSPSPKLSPVQVPRTPERRLPTPPICKTTPISPSEISGTPSPSRQRINRYDVQQRLFQQHSFGSPIGAGSPKHFDGPESGSDDAQMLNTMEAIVEEDVLCEEETESNQDDAHEDDVVHTTIPEISELDFGTKFGINGLGGTLNSKEQFMPSPIGGPRMELRPVGVDMDMRSALDRLMDDVAGGKLENVSMATGDSQKQPELPRPRIMQKAATDSAIIIGGGGMGITSRSVSSSSTYSIPPPPPPKDNIRSREAMILEKRREMRRLEEGGEEAFFTNLAAPTNGRPSRRRSMSTGDLKEGHKGSLLEIGSAESDSDPLGDSIEKELRKSQEKRSKIGYHVREAEATIYASSSSDGVFSHMKGPGDVNPGKAWRAVRRPSDMNEFSKQIREYREQEKSGKAYGKVFVKVLGVKNIHVPIPTQPTVIACTLNNGIHFVTTPEAPFSSSCPIDQEFELIEHSKLEFTLTLKIRRDQHIIEQFKSLAPPPQPTTTLQVQVPSSKGGMRSFFSSSPKKPKEKNAKSSASSQPPFVHRLPENLARYLKSDGTLARAFVAFKDIGHRCDTRLFETTFPLIGQRVEVGNKFSTLQVGEITLQFFRLPPLPGFKPEQLPQSLDECIRGLRHINWHKVTYFEGTLTQSGGDCTSWRRRHFRVIGSKLVAFNDVTKKATATINLDKAMEVEDIQSFRSSIMTPSSHLSGRSTRFEDDDELFGVERSFRLIFPDEGILFFADTDEEKSRWLEVLRALVGHIPPHPLWAELLWQRQEEVGKKSQPAGQATSFPRKPAPPA